jgi:oxygen-independent coproporphyrinogen-3 oxidase
MRSLYAHFPFCETKCHYCDFYSIAAARTTIDDRDRFVEALRTEATLLRDRLAPELDTIFLGGGTPSMTAPDRMARALEPLWERTRLSPTGEWTMEANPSSITLDGMKAYRALGVNRVSMGVQAFRDDHLKLLGRVHDREGAFRALDSVFDAGFDNVSVDLLCGIPGQSLGDLEDALRTFTSFPIAHLSCYLLTLPPHHKMFKQLPDEETQLEHLLLIDRWMVEQGFEHYEISNFARPGRRARHNLVYWQGGSYLGLGPSAHSFDAPTARRWKNVSSLHRYAETLSKNEPPVEWEERLSPEQRRLEEWILALRLSEGFPKSWLDDKAKQTRAEALQQEGLLIAHPTQSGRLRLTPRGFALSDQIIATLAR